MDNSQEVDEVITAIRTLPIETLRRIIEVVSAKNADVRNLVRLLIMYEASNTARGPPQLHGNGSEDSSQQGADWEREQQHLMQQPDHFRWASTSFMLFSFKVKPCHNNKPHNFRTCPFGHPPNWIRRDPRQCRYVPVPCPYHAAGSCTLDGCPYAHSLLECSLHPYNYRNSRCRHGSRCTETVCFFAHSDHELRKPSKQYSPTIEEFKAAEELRSPLDRSRVNPEALLAAEAKARTLLRSSSPPGSTTGGSTMLHSPGRGGGQYMGMDSGFANSRAPDMNATVNIRNAGGLPMGAPKGALGAPLASWPEALANAAGPSRTTSLGQPLGVEDRFSAPWFVNRNLGGVQQGITTGVGTGGNEGGLSGSPSSGPSFGAPQGASGGLPFDVNLENLSQLMGFMQLQQNQQQNQQGPRAFEDSGAANSWDPTELQMWMQNQNKQQ